MLQLIKKCQKLLHERVSFVLLCVNSWTQTFLKNWNSNFHHHLYFLFFLSLPKVGLLHLISIEFYILFDNEICQAKDFLEYGY